MARFVTISALYRTTLNTPPTDQMYLLYLSCALASFCLTSVADSQGQTIAIVGGVIFAILYVTRGIHNTLQAQKEKCVFTSESTCSATHMDFFIKGWNLGDTTFPGPEYPSRPTSGLITKPISMQLRGTYACVVVLTVSKRVVFYRGLVQALGASSTGHGSKPVLGQFSLAPRDERSSTTESLGRHGEEEKRHRHLHWRAKHSEKDVLWVPCTRQENGTSVITSNFSKYVLPALYYELNTPLILR